jgi:hypothetical protein
MRSPQKQPFLAPWWASPQVAYWSGQPGVAGTSHQSLAGIVDTARFFLAEKPADAAAILRDRGVRYVIIDDTSHTANDLSELLIVSNSQSLLGLKQTSAQPLGDLLAKQPRLAPPFLRHVKPEERGLVLHLPQLSGESKPDDRKMQIYLPQYHQLYAVDPDKL